MKAVTILGSTGSVGTQALSVIADNPELFSVYALSAHRQVKELAEQARIFKPKKVVIAEHDLYSELKIALHDLSIELMAGHDALCEVAAEQEQQMVLNALVGFAGLQPTLAALNAGKDVALANKESLVAGGHLVMSLASKHNSALIPVDSEHSAIYQCLQGQQVSAVENLIITASGGPFFDRPADTLKDVTPQDALKHPNWAMGAKITIDSATMMNKGLEVIEAHWLFAMDYAKIKVVVHRESIIHSMVTLHDGAVLAQLGIPNMRVPIQYALTYPTRTVSNAPRLQWEQISKLHFAQPDNDKFPCLALAYHAGLTGGSLPTALNAANEEAVQLFLARKVSFLAIPRIIESVMNKHKVINAPDLAALIETDREARSLALEYA